MLRQSWSTCYAVWIHNFWFYKFEYRLMQSFVRALWVLSELTESCRSSRGLVRSHWVYSEHTEFCQSTRSLVRVGLPFVKIHSNYDLCWQSNTHMKLGCTDCSAQMHITKSCININQWSRTLNRVHVSRINIQARRSKQAHIACSKTTHQQHLQQWSKTMHCVRHTATKRRNNNISELHARVAQIEMARREERTLLCNSCSTLWPAIICFDDLLRHCDQQSQRIPQASPAISLQDLATALIRPHGMDQCGTDQ